MLQGEVILILNCISDVISQLCKEKGATLEELAIEIGVSGQAVSKWREVK